jgi:hypothetical protein
MALTITPVVRDDSAGNRKLTVTDITTDNSYAAGGFPLTPANLGLNRVFFGLCSITTAAATGNAVDASLDVSSPTAPKLKLVAAAAEVANAAGTGAVVRVIAWGY